MGWLYCHNPGRDRNEGETGEDGARASVSPGPRSGQQPIILLVK